ncbi:helix-turn-helix transcriptional regulator [Saccharopolyspora sp. NPDC050389]|uniref:helix-turn-helix transcriptional regulator n=1 Tax=Saccharopolyspora sp. NPDC050389 TaxID=3155516 RepID=UPI0033FE6B8A
MECRSDHRGWSEAEVHESYRMVLVRSGRFRRRVAGVAADITPTSAYLGVPGEEEHFAHPAGGDVCTSIGLTPELWRSLAGESSRPRPTAYVDAQLDLAHRRVLATMATGDAGYALTEQLLGLLTTALTQVVDGRTPSEAPPATAVLVSAAREAIAAGHPAARGLLPLAELLGVSPYRLSRAFPLLLGVSLTRYRNRVRVGQALDRLEQGERSLGELAADLGFADQAHLCRTVRAHLGHTPTELRRLLAA